MSVWLIFLSSLTSNSLGSRQNIKNLVGNLLGKRSSYLRTKISSLTFKLREPFRWRSDRQTDIKNSTVDIFNCSHNYKDREKFMKHAFNYKCYFINLSLTSKLWELLKTKDESQIIFFQNLTHISNLTRFALACG